MPEPFYFICYSSLDLATALKLTDKLTAGPPSIAVWLDKRKIQPGIDWDLQIAEALSTYAGVLYLMSEDSVPSLQQVLKLDEGLASPHAENVLKAMDKDGSLGLREATAPLNEARIATRGYPRALEAIVGILRTDRSTTLAELLAELRALHPTAEDVVRDLVGEAFSRLDPLAQEVMQALAIYGAPVPAVAVDYLLQPYRVGIDSAKVLGRLVNTQFARVRQDASISTRSTATTR